MSLFPSNLRLVTLCASGIRNELVGGLDYLKTARRRAAGRCHGRLLRPMPEIRRYKKLAVWIDLSPGHLPIFRHIVPLHRTGYSTLRDYLGAVDDCVLATVTLG